MSRSQMYPRLRFHGNPCTMNLNHLLLTNIQSSLYFKKKLVDLTTFSEVVDEIYYKVDHLEPWERGSDHVNKSFKVFRGVGGSGIPSTAFCLLYKLHTLKPTYKQVVQLILHEDSPYIRGIGFLYIRFTQSPDCLWDWYKDFVFNEETLSVKSGQQYSITLGEMVQALLFQNDWLSAWLPRIPVSTVKKIQQSFLERDKGHVVDEEDKNG